jgi:ribosome-associated protein
LDNSKDVYMTKEFALHGQEYIELNKLLKLLRMVASGGEANQVILNSEVTVNGSIELQKRKKLRLNYKVTFNGTDVIIVE